MALTRTTAGLLFADDFNRADGAPGANWTIDSGSWAIVSNKLSLTNGADGNTIRATAVALRNETVVQALITKNNNNKQPGLWAKYVAGTRGYLDHFGNAQLLLFRFVGPSSFTIIDNDVMASGAISAVLKLHVKDSLQKHWLDGTLKGTVTETNHNGQTGHPGIRNGSSSSSGVITIDNYVVCPSNSITVNGLSTGLKAQILDGSDVVLAGPTSETAGVVVLDCLGATFPFAKLQILDALDEVVQEWTGSGYGGDVFDYTGEPTVVITDPADETEIEFGELLDFSGTATDTEDGDLSAGIVWTSSIDGPIGTGATVAGASLNPGVHTIIARSTDSDDNIGSATITVTVTGGEEEPDQPTLQVRQSSGEDMIGADEVTLQSSAYSGPSPHYDAEYVVYLDGEEIARVVSLVGDDDSWRYPTIGDLGPPLATLTAVVRHAYLDDDVRVVGPYSEPVEFTLIEEEDEGEDDNFTHVAGTSVLYRSEYPYGTWRRIWPLPDFIPEQACGTYSLLWCVMRHNASSRNAYFSGGFTADFALCGQKAGYGGAWKYFCDTGGIKTQHSGVGDLKELWGHTPFAQDTPYIDQPEFSNLEPNQLVTGDTLTFRWFESELMWVAGVSALPSTDFYGIDTDLFQDALDVITDAGPEPGASSTYLWPDFGGLWRIRIKLGMDGDWLTLATNLPFGGRYFNYNPASGVYNWLARRYYTEDGVDIEGWEEVLDLTEVHEWMEENDRTAIFTQIELQLDGRAPQYSHPFVIDIAEESTLHRKDGTEIQVADLTFAGSDGAAGRFTEFAEGLRHTGAANAVDVAMVNGMEQQVSFEGLVVGSWATRRSAIPAAYGFAFQLDRDKHWGLAGYLLHEGSEFSALGSRLAGTFMANGANRLYNQGEGASPFSWWGNGYYHGQGSANAQITQSGPRGTVTSLAEFSDVGIDQWNRSPKGYGPTVAGALTPVYTQWLKIDRLATNLDGTHRVRVTAHIHGPNTDETLTVIRDNFQWDCGDCGLIFRSLRDGGMTEVYSYSFLPLEEGDCATLRATAFGSPCDSLIAIGWNPFGELGS